MEKKSIFSKYKRHATTVVWLTALVVTAGLLLYYEHHVLWKIQEQNLFLDTPLFFRQQMVVPGGLLTYVGCFLTQLLYYPLLGVTVLCVWWGLLMELMRRTFCVEAPWSLLLLVPIGLLLIANVDMGYWIYPIKLKGWYFDATIGVTTIVALLWAYRALSSSRCWRRVLLVVTVLVGYPLTGSYALAAALLIALWSWRLDRQRWQALIESILALLMVVAVPLLCYHYVYYQTNIKNLWWAGLPIFKILEENPEFYLPYALLGACLVLLVVGIWKKEDHQVKKYKIWLQNVTVVGVLTAMVFGIYTAWMKDENFHCEVAMEHFAEECRWEDVLDESAKHQTVPTRAIVMMRNLALSRLGRQSTEMYRYRNGSKKPASPFPIQASMLVGNMIYYHYGMLNDCHHMCVEAGVEFGWRVEHLKYMARCSLMSNEVNAMYKYTELLKHTLFHGPWAERLEGLQVHAEQRREDKETGPVMHMLQYPDIVGSDHGYTEKYLMNHLAQMNSDDPIFQEQCLLASLWTKNSRQFWSQFAKYLRYHPGQPVPRYYLEAAYLYTVTQESAPFQVTVDQDIQERYQSFMGLLPQYDGIDIEAVRSALFPMYGDTYFFEYFLMDDLIYI